MGGLKMAHAFNYKTVVLSESEYDRLMELTNTNKIIEDLLDDIKLILTDNYSEQLANDIVKCLTNYWL